MGLVQNLCGMFVRDCEMFFAEDDNGEEGKSFVEFEDLNSGQQKLAT